MATRPDVEHDLILDIEGMTCASCVDRLERVLSRQPAVSEARVSLATRTAAIRCTVADPAPYILAVERAGYGAAVHRSDSARPDDTRYYARRLVVAAVCSFYVLGFSFVVAPGSRASVILAWLFATPVQFYCGWPFLRNALRAARHGTHTMDTLVACGSLAAYGYSVLALGGHHQAYFDTASMIVTLILLGKFLEARARSRAGDATRLLLERGAKEALRLEGGAERLVPVGDLRVGDVVVVLPGQTIPADGRVRGGTSAVDLSMITGESIPMDVAPGGDVVGGSLNGQGRLEVELTQVGAETRLAQIVRLLEVTQASKAPMQRLADRVAAAFVPRILLLALVSFFIRAFLGSAGVGSAVLHAAAVLLVACPCSLGLATPVAIMAGSGRAAALGILVKGGEVFEAARRVDVVLLDKTGTVTEGRMVLRRVVSVDAGDADGLLGLAAAVERGSDHPIARCVVDAAEERGVAIPEAEGYEARAGVGVTATVDGVRTRVGRPDGLPPHLELEADRLASEGLTVFAVWREDEPVGLLGSSDSVKEEAAAVVARLGRANLDVALVSGDRAAAVGAVARQVGITRSIADVLPEGKVEEVRRLQAMGRRVAFVGDGINDAPALAQADLGIALDTGTDVAMEAADVLIMGSDLRRVSDCLALSRRTFWIIAQNLVWAFAYNVLMIPLAVVGVVSPMVAAAAMAGSSVTVVGNALRLRRFRGTTAPPFAPSTGPVVRAEADPAPAPEPEPDLDRAIGPAPQPAAGGGLATMAARSGRGGQEPAQADSNGTGSFARQEARRIAVALGRLFERQWEI